jgi:hypothetical protein
MSKQFILYAIPNESNSNKALSMVRTNLDHTCDPTKLQNLPEWLTGVPTILNLESKDVYEGTQCLLYMQKRNQEIIKTQKLITKTKPLEDTGVIFIEDIQNESNNTEEESKTEESTTTDDDSNTNLKNFFPKTDKKLYKESTSPLNLGPPVLEDVSDSIPVQLNQLSTLTEGDEEEEERNRFSQYNQSSDYVDLLSNISPTIPFMGGMSGIAGMVVIRVDT